MRSAHALLLGMLLTLAAPAAKSQASPSPAPQPAQGAAKPAAPKATAKPSPQAGKPAQAAGKPAKKTTAAAKPAAPAAKKPARAAKKSSGSAAAPAESEVKLVRRDPFESLVGRQKALADAAKNLPPGKAGLQVSTLRLDGVVRSPNGMIAVVSNPQQRTYFLREGDQLYDGRVEKIMMDSVSFHEVGKDAFGKPVERQVNKRIYASPGEQQ